MLRLAFVLLTGLLAALAVPPGRAEVAGEAWVSRHYGSSDGLPVGSATGAALDADGFLWLATHDGLARFDGAHFEVYDSLRFPAMSGNRILSVHRDEQGRVFALTEPGDWLRVESDRIRSALADQATGLGARYVDPGSLCVTTTMDLQCPDAEGRYHVRLEFPPGVDPALALPGREDEAWLLSRQRDVWLRRHGRWLRLWQAGALAERAIRVSGVVAADGSLWTEMGERLLHVSPDGEQTWWNGGDDPGQVIEIRRDADGDVWVGAGNGLFRVRAGQPERVFVADVDAGEDGVGYTSWRAPDGARWIAGSGQLWRFDRGEEAAGWIGAEPVFRSGGRIQSLSFGPDGLVWVMSLHDGLHRLNRARVDVLDQLRGLAGNNIYGISRGRDGSTWLGSLGAGLMAIAPDDSVRTYGTGDGLPGNNPWVVSVAADGTVYTATYGPGLWRKQPGQARFEAAPLPPELEQEQIRAVVFSADDAIWLGSSAGAWSRQHGQWRKRWPQTGRRVRVGAIVLAGSRVWLGSDEGVWELSGEQARPVAGALLGHTSIRGLDRSSDGALWISTDGRGLVRIAPDDPEGLQPLQLTRREGLPSNTPHGVREDAQGNLWVNSNQGIFRISHSGLSAVLAGTEQRLAPLSLGLSDGLSELEGNGGVQPAMAEGADGRFWFASQSGVVRFDPLAIPLHESAPHARIDGLEHEGAPLLPDDTGRLPVGVRSLRVHFGAADLVGNGQTRFRHRLLPGARGWTDALNERSAQFSALAPGRYRFQLLAGNSDGIWASEPVEMVFEVPSHWHEITAVRGAALGLLIVLLGLGGWWRVRHLQRRARLLDREVRSRTRELRHEKVRVERAMDELAQAHRSLEERNLALAGKTDRLEKLDRFRSRVLANVSHELRTPVMLVGLPLEELDRDATGLGEDARARLRLARNQLERLRALVEQLVNLIQAESGQMPLRLSRLDLGAFLQRLIEDYRPKAARTGVELVLREPARLDAVFADSAHLATIFGNLVDNALKYAPSGSAVTLALQATEDGVVIEVRDQGPGFDAHQAGRLFERFYRAEGPPRQGREGLGIGLSLVQELVQLHGGQITAESRPGEGAVFRVWLPGGSEHVALQDLALAASDAAIAPIVPSTETADAEGCILLVEDHPDLASYLSERLGERICTVCAGSAEAALQVLAEDPRIRLVVSDVMLPGLDGIALCEQLSAAPVGQRLPVILISARAAHHDIDAGLAAGAAAYLAKPFGFDDLLQAITAAWPAVGARLQPPVATPEALDPLLQLALARLPDAEFSIGQWGELAHLSERQLRRRVKELSGQSPQNWLREQRLLRVHQLLRDGHCKTLLEAGQRCGLENPSYLYRSYRARFGTA